MGRVCFLQVDNRSMIHDRSLDPLVLKKPSVIRDPSQFHNDIGRLNPSMANRMNYIQLSALINESVCNLSGWTHRRMLLEKDYCKGRYPTWCKIKAVREAMDEWDVVMFCDNDAWVCDHCRLQEIVNDLRNDQQYWMYISDEMLNQKPHGKMVNTGFFAVRVCQEAKDFFDKVWNTDKKKFFNERFHEQSVISEYIRERKVNGVKEFPKYTFNSPVGEVVKHCWNKEEKMDNWAPDTIWHMMVQDYCRYSAIMVHFTTLTRRIKHQIYRSPTGSPLLYIAFQSYFTPQQKVQSVRWDNYKRLQSTGANVIWFADTENMWYEDAWEYILSVISSFRGENEHIQDIILTGMSMGGWAAMRLSLTMNHVRILAIAPQLTLTKNNEGDLAMPSSFTKACLTGGRPELRQLVNPNNTYHIHYAKGMPFDSKSAELLGGLANVHLHGHDSPRHHFWEHWSSQMVDQFYKF